MSTQELERRIADLQARLSATRLYSERLAMDQRQAYERGYAQAEKDCEERTKALREHASNLESIIRDVIDDLLDEQENPHQNLNWAIQALRVAISDPAAKR